MLALKITARLSCGQLVGWLSEGLCALELSVYQHGAQICPVTLSETWGHSSAQRGVGWGSVNPLQQAASVWGYSRPSASQMDRHGDEGALCTPVIVRPQGQPDVLGACLLLPG